MSELFDDADILAEHKQDAIIDHGTFIAVPTWVYENFKKELGHMGLAVYVALKSYANRKRGNTTFVAVKSIAEDLGMGQSTVRREISKLEELNLVSRSFSVGKPTNYYISQTPPPYGVRHGIEETPPPYGVTPPPHANITRCINQKKELTISALPLEMNETQELALDQDHLETISPVGALVESIYKEYPKKVAKPAALKSIKKAIHKVLGDENPGNLKTVHDAFVYLKDKTAAFAKERKGQDETFTPHPATWFNNSRYNDVGVGENQAVIKVRYELVPGNVTSK